MATPFRRSYPVALALAALAAAALWAYPLPDCFSLPSTPDLQGARLPAAFRLPAQFLAPPPAPTTIQGPFAFIDLQPCAEPDADIVLSVHVAVPGVLSGAHDFPIRARLTVRGPGLTPIAGYGFETDTVCADNPDEGTGFVGGVSLSDLTDTAATARISYSWTDSQHTRGKLEYEAVVPFGAPLFKRLAGGTTVRATWRTPRRAIP